MSLENGMTPADFAAINGNDGFGNSAWWLILLFLFWGFNGNGYGCGGNANVVGADLQRGFDQSAISNQVDGLQNTMYTNQIAGMNQSFANQQALDARLGTLEMSLQNCCCENRQNIADLKYTIATENCADRAAVTEATQKILDAMCQDKIDAKNERIQSLENQINMLTLQASQVAQTAEIKSFIPTTAAAGN